MMSMETFTATYHDGQTAAAYPAQVRVQGTTLHVNSADGRFDAFVWHADELVRMSGKGAAKVRLGLKSEDGQRLVFEQSSMPEDLSHLTLKSVESLNRPGNVKLFGWAVAGIASIAFFIFYGLQAISSLAVTFVPESWDKSVWAQIDPVEQGTWPVCTGGGGQIAMDILKEELLPHTRFKPDDIHIRVVKLNMSNAFAFPGGGIVFTSKLIDEAKTPAEIAGVLAHELGHVEHRHGTKAMIESLGLGAALTVLLGDATGAVIVATLSEQLLRASYTRDKEEQSDEFAMNLLTKSGIGTEGMTRFFERLTKRDGDVPALLSTHPVTEDRIDYFANGPDATRDVLTDGQWKALKSICDKATQARKPEAT